jgi:hypothetical protein
METSAPGINSSAPHNAPKEAMPIERVSRRLTGFSYYLSFIKLLAALVLAIIALVKDDLTKLIFRSNNQPYVQYCGWRNIHSYDSSTSFVGNQRFNVNYSKECGNWDRGCTLETIGTAWYALLIIGIVFGGLSAISYVFDCPAMVSRVIIMLCNLIFFGCMLADALIWGIYKTCHNACNSLDFPNTPDSVTSCKPKWGISWILVIVAGGLALLSTICLLASKTNRKF